MDIITRIPKKQLEHFWNDKATSPIAFWRFARRPKNLNEGDYIWFTTTEGVVAGAKVLEILSGEELSSGLFMTDDKISNFNAM
jgi:hypothetical protein